MRSGYYWQIHLKSLTLRGSVQLTRQLPTCLCVMLLTRHVLKRIPMKPFLQQSAAKIPWFHHCMLLDKVKDYQEHLWYVQQRRSRLQL
jgi:hypothetical protein